MRLRRILRGNSNWITMTDFSVFFHSLIFLSSSMNFVQSTGAEQLAMVLRERSHLSLSEIVRAIFKNSNQPSSLRIFLSTARIS